MEMLQSRRRGDPRRERGIGWRERDPNPRLRDGVEKNKREERVQEMKNERREKRDGAYMEGGIVSFL